MSLAQTYNRAVLGRPWLWLMLVAVLVVGLLLWLIDTLLSWAMSGVIG